MAIAQQNVVVGIKMSLDDAEEAGIMDKYLVSVGIEL